jgi:hypothetical protein
MEDREREREREREKRMEIINVFKFCYSFIHMCIHCLGHSSPCPHPLSPHPSLLPDRTCSALISNFVEEKT